MARYQVGLILPDIAQYLLINSLLTMRQLGHSVAQGLLVEVVK